MKLRYSDWGVRGGGRKDGFGGDWTRGILLYILPNNGEICTCGTETTTNEMIHVSIERALQVLPLLRRAPDLFFFESEERNAREGED